MVNFTCSARRWVQVPRPAGDGESRAAVNVLAPCEPYRACTFKLASRLSLGQQKSRRSASFPARSLAGCPASTQPAYCAQGDRHCSCLAENSRERVPMHHPIPSPGPNNPQPPPAARLHRAAAHSHILADAQQSSVLSKLHRRISRRQPVPRTHESLRVRKRSPRCPRSLRLRGFEAAPPRSSGPAVITRRPRPAPPRHRDHFFPFEAASGASSSRFRGCCSHCCLHCCSRVLGRSPASVRCSLAEPDLAFSHI